MGLFGKLIGTALDVVTSPIAVVRDVIPGGGGYVDGCDSKTYEKAEEIRDDLHEVRHKLEEL